MKREGKGGGIRGERCKRVDEKGQGRRRRGEGEMVSSGRKKS